MDGLINNHVIYHFRTDVTKDDKLKTLSSSQCGLVELAALVFYRVGIPEAHYLYSFFVAYILLLTI